MKNYPSLADKTIFESTFNVSLLKFFNPGLGFDLVGFDEFIKTPDGVSTKQFITEKYGQHACQLIMRMI